MVLNLASLVLTVLAFHTGNAVYGQVTVRLGETASLYYHRSRNESSEHFRAYRVKQNGVPFRILERGFNQSHCTVDKLKEFCIKTEFEKHNVTHLLLRIKGAVGNDSGEYAVHSVFKQLGKDSTEEIMLNVTSDTTSDAFESTIPAQPTTPHTDHEITDYTATHDAFESTTPAQPTTPLKFISDHEITATSDSFEPTMPAQPTTPHKAMSDYKTAAVKNISGTRKVLEIVFPLAFVIPLVIVGTLLYCHRGQLRRYYQMHGI